MDNDEQPPHNHHGGSLRLPLFWAENSEAWFGIAESRFRLRNIEDEQVKFDLVVNALPKECLRTVLDLVTNPPEEVEVVGGGPTQGHLCHVVCRDLRGYVGGQVRRAGVYNL